MVAGAKLPAMPDQRVREPRQRVLAFFLLAGALFEGPRLIGEVRRATPPSRRAAADGIGRTVYAVLAKYFAGSLLVALANGMWVAMVALLGVAGGLDVGLHHGWQPDPPQAVAALEPLGLFLILRAFASGCSAMTGIEAIANGKNEFLSLLELDMKAANKLAKALEDHFNVPGLKARNDPVAATRVR